jgi:stage III sporulation protein SpoIIIAA
MNEDYPVFDKWYRILSWIMDMCEKYPKSVRFSLSGRIASMSIDIIESIIEAIYAKKRCYILMMRKPIYGKV